MNFLAGNFDMRRFFLFSVLMLLPVLPLVAQKTKTVSIVYLYQVPDNVTPDDAKTIALDRAKIQAIADEFGTVVTQSNMTNIEIENGETTSHFISSGGSELKGEWIETIGEPTFEFITEGTSLAIRVWVKGKIRELKGAKIPVNVRIFKNGIDDCNESSDFMTGDALYMSFCSSADGYIAIYLVDSENQVYCLLPYQGQASGFYPTKANNIHILFNKDYAKDVKKDIVDEFLMDTDKEKERNRILTIFSPNKFFKAVDSKDQEDLPRSLCYSEFIKWLSDIKKRDVELVVSEASITISK